MQMAVTAPALAQLGRDESLRLVRLELLEVRLFKYVFVLLLY